MRRIGFKPSARLAKWAGRAAARRRENEREAAELRPDLQRSIMSASIDWSAPNRVLDLHQFAGTYGGHQPAPTPKRGETLRRMIRSLFR